MSGALAFWTRRGFLGASATAATLAVLPGCTTASAPPSGSDAAKLQERIGGTVVVRSDPDYETWRKAMIWQRAKAKRRPDMIVQVDSIDDVREAVSFAAEHGLKVTTRCGGHSMAACFLRDKGMLIDISRLDGVKIDKASKIAEVGPGVICRGLAELLDKEGLAFPGAHCGTVAISGFLLGGGVGMNTNAWSSGMSVFAVKGVDIVTAEGQLLHASAEENPDLFWAARGGGPGLFGVVVKFYLQCFDAPKVIWGATYAFRYEDFPEVVAVMEQIVPQLDTDVEVLSFLGPGPEAAPDAKHEERLVAYIDANAFVASEEIGKRKLEKLTNHPLIAKAIVRVENRAGNFDRYYNDNEAAFPQTHWMGDSVWVDDPKKAAEIIQKHVPDCPSPRQAPLLLYMGTNPMPDAACSVIGRFYLAYYFEWDKAEDEAPTRAFSRKLFKELKTVAKGSYINEMDQEGRPEDIATCYSPAAWKRLADLRTKWDPKGLFHGFYGQS